MNGYIRSVFVIAGILLVITSCDLANVSQNSIKPKLSQTESDVLESGNSFSISLFKQLTKEDTSSTNLVISPLSASIALGMTMNGAMGKTKEEMKSVLRVKKFNLDQINNTYKKTIEDLIQMDPEVDVKLANAIFYRQNIGNDKLILKKSFENKIKQYFNAELSNDFRAKAMNNWVTNNTNGKITKLVKSVDKNSYLVLLNALYFKGIWRLPFDEENTKDQEFYTSKNDTVQVPFMRRQGGFSYFNNEKITTVDIAYGDSLYSMTFLMPRKEYGINQITNQLTEDKIQTLISNLKNADKSHIQLPKFTIKYDTKLNNVLQSMGMNIAFSNNKANFSNIFENSLSNLAISLVRQKVYIKVNEEGTEAAAATEVKLNRSGENIFNFDQPFIFVIRERIGNSILFMGKVGNPKYQ